MSYPINYPTPQGANVQIFRGGDNGTTAHLYTRDWVKPQGASFVWFTLIGAGGGGSASFLDSSGPFYFSGGGGASGNVTNFMCPAFLLPDMLQVRLGRGGDGSLTTNPDIAPSNGTSGTATYITYQQKDGNGYTLLQASGGGAGLGVSGYGTGGTASAADAGGPMTAAGFYNAVGGQNGATGNVSITTNGFTFIMGGQAGGDTSVVIAGYYGYSASMRGGYSQLSPIPLAIPNTSTTSASLKSTPQSFGCGGSGGGVAGVSGGSGGRGGDGLAIIVTW